MHMFSIPYINNLINIIIDLYVFKTGILSVRVYYNYSGGLSIFTLFVLNNILYKEMGRAWIQR